MFFLKVDLTLFELDNQYWEWNQDPWDVKACVLPETELDESFKMFGYPAWSKQNCEGFLRFQTPKTCSAEITMGNSVNEDKVENFTGTFNIH